MALYKIGITEAGDAGIDLSWADKLTSVDGAILVTKRVSFDFCEAALKHKDKLIVHATLTGYGHSVLEPHVPTPHDQFDAIMTLVDGGFPKEKIVIRVDPIIPTNKGIATAYNVMVSFMEQGFSRFRVSVIDMYPHARERFMNAGLPLPHGEHGFSPNQFQLSEVDNMLLRVKLFWTELKTGEQLRIESCAEPGLHEAISCGCISNFDLNLLGLSVTGEAESAGYQRRNCLCYSGKTELLKHKTRCPHRCLYCYWRDKS